jgi:hypothetical protein
MCVILLSTQQAGLCVSRTGAAQRTVAVAVAALALVMFGRRPPQGTVLLPNCVLMHGLTA